MRSWRTWPWGDWGYRAQLGWNEKDKLLFNSDGYQWLRLQNWRVLEVMQEVLLMLVEWWRFSGSSKPLEKKNLLSHWKFCPIITRILHCERLTWNRRIPQLKRKIIFPISFFGFHMIFFQGLDFGWFRLEVHSEILFCTCDLTYVLARPNGERLRQCISKSKCCMFMFSVFWRRYSKAFPLSFSDAQTNQKRTFGMFLLVKVILYKSYFLFL